MPDGRKVKIFTLTNKNGLKAKVTEYGAILVSMEVPDKSGKSADVTLGYDTLAGWLTNTSYFGATVGRFGNRIKDGKFTLDGKEYTLATNNDPGGIPCHLHGGLKGFDKVLWSGKPTARQRRGVLLHRQGRRGRLSGKSRGESHLHPQRSKRTQVGSQGDHRRADGSQPRPPLLLESLRRPDPVDQRPRPDAECRWLSCRPTSA